MVQLSCVEAKDAAAVAKAMEAEASTWLRRYPIPVMITAFPPQAMSSHSMASARAIT